MGERRPSALPAALGAVLLVGALVAFLVLGPLSSAFSYAVHGDLVGLRRQLDAEGASAALALVGLTQVHIVVPFPAELPNAAAGFALGWWIGFPLMLAAWVLSGVVSYWLAQVAGRPLVRRLFGADRLARAEELVARRGWRPLLIIRMIPFIPFTLVSLACGLVGVPMRRYLWTTAVGTAPITALSVLFGARLQTPRLDDPVLWAVLVGLLALVLLGPVAQRLSRRPDPATSGAQTPRSGG